MTETKKKPKTKLQWIVDYFLITGFVWGLYLIWLVPFQYYRVGLTEAQLIHWLIEGTIYEMIFTYPLAKTVAKYTPKITNWVQVNV